MENWKDLKRVLINRMEKLMLLDKQNRTKKILEWKIGKIWSKSMSEGCFFFTEFFFGVKAVVKTWLTNSNNISISYRFVVCRVFFVSFKVMLIYSYETIWRWIIFVYRFIAVGVGCVIVIHFECFYGVINF